MFKDKDKEKLEMKCVGYMATYEIFIDFKSPEMRAYSQNQTLKPGVIMYAQEQKDQMEHKYSPNYIFEGNKLSQTMQFETKKGWAQICRND